jgi:hypothetical protein
VSEDRTRARLAGHRLERPTEIEQVPRWGHHASAVHQALDMASAAQGDEQGDRATTYGDLHGSTRLDLAEILARSLSQLPQTDGLHDATL